MKRIGAYFLLLVSLLGVMEDLKAEAQPYPIGTLLFPQSNRHTSSGILTGIGGGLALGSALTGMATAQVVESCRTADAFVWEVSEEERKAEICIDAFNGLGNHKEAELFSKANALARGNNQKLRDSLNVEASATGMPPDPDGCDAHHIVPAQENRAWARQYVVPARAILASCKIDINSVENGVYLPRNASTKAQCEGRSHANMHTKAYYMHLIERLDDAKNRDGCVGVRDVLNNIKNDLSKGVL